MKFKFWGVRGSLPIPGKDFVKYGGNTPCFEIIPEDSNEVFIIDAGTGIFNLGSDILKRKNVRKINIIFTHYHWDHIQGLPFFAPFMNENYEVNIYFNNDIIDSGDTIIRHQMLPAFFPVSIEDSFKAKINFIDISDRDIFTIGNIKFEKKHTHHSKGTYAYKVYSENGKNLVFMTDNEIFCKEEEIHPTEKYICELNNDLIKFCKGTDILVHDSQFFEINFSQFLGWGHSNNASTTFFAHHAEIKKLYLFHYDPHNTDLLVDKMLNESKHIAKDELNSDLEIFASYEGLEIKL